MTIFGSEPKNHFCLKIFIFDRIFQSWYSFDSLGKTLQNDAFGSLFGHFGGPIWANCRKKEFCDFSDPKNRDF